MERISISMPLDMLRAVRRQMKRQNKTMSAIIRESLAMWLEQEAGEIVEYHVSRGGYRGEPNSTKEIIA